MIQIADSLVHRTPSHLRLALPFAAAADFELAGIVDHRFHTQDHSKLIVHLQPILFDAMLHARSRFAVLLAVGQDFTVEARMQAAAQEAQHVLRREVQRGVIE